MPPVSWVTFGSSPGRSLLTWGSVQDWVMPFLQLPRWPLRDILVRRPYVPAFSTLQESHEGKNLPFLLDRKLRERKDNGQWLPLCTSESPSQQGPDTRLTFKALDLLLPQPHVSLPQYSHDSSPPSSLFIEASRNALPYRASS